DRYRVLVHVGGATTRFDDADVHAHATRDRHDVQVLLLRVVADDMLVVASDGQDRPNGAACAVQGARHVQPFAAEELVDRTGPIHLAEDEVGNAVRAIHYRGRGQRDDGGHCGSSLNAVAVVIVPCGGTSVPPRGRTGHGVTLRLVAGAGQQRGGQARLPARPSQLGVLLQVRVNVLGDLRTGQTERVQQLGRRAALAEAVEHAQA